MEARQSMEERIVEWRQHLDRHPSIHHVDTEELEDHLRSQIDALLEVDLDEEEAFLVAVKRLGDTHSLSREFAREYSERLWKQLLPSGPDAEPSTATKDSFIAVGLAVGAAAAIKIPQLFGVEFGDDPGDASFYARHISLLILPFVAALFAIKRGFDQRTTYLLTAPFVASAVLMNVIPFYQLGSTELLAAIHLPIALWFAVGYAYVGGRWRNHVQRMNFVRFTGEWVIYLALIALGGGVLTGFTVLLFESIGLDTEPFITTWLIPCGVAGAMVISSWLVEAKQSIIENMAPVLTRLFTPLFTVLLLSFIVANIVSGSAILVDRDVLIGFDLLLVLILGLLLYSISARDPEAPPNLFDKLQFLLVVSALIVDGLALWAIAMRISEFGFSPNKVAALGENLILLVNLGWSAVLSARFLFKRVPFATLERWQTAYLPVYPIWAAVVAVLFPVLFNFR
ncbi:hypothetical protein KQI52_00085 [bacterium]|nr:hypothetical protein [bacterium]